MPRYADGFVIVVPKKKLEAYRALSKKAGKVWKEYGALEYCECAADDVNVKFGTPFGKLTNAKKNETVVFSWIVFKSKAHRDRVNAKVMKDKRIAPEATGEMPFDMQRMSYGGFELIVDL